MLTMGSLIIKNPVKLQGDLNICLKLFTTLGLHANQVKTKFMVIRGPKAPARIADVSYNKRMNKDRTEPWDRDWRKLRVNCDICGKEECNGSLVRHKKIMHGMMWMVKKPFMTA